MLQLNVPFIKTTDIEHSAAELLRKYSKWKGGSPPRPPIDVDDIVDGYLDLDYAVADLEKILGVADVLGATWLEEKKVRIDSRLEGKEGRFAFTLAHETGHWWLHRPIFEMEKVTLPLVALDDKKPATPAIVCRTSQRKARAEVQADLFAACLLMPASDVRVAVRELCGIDPPSWAGLRAKAKSGQLDEQLKDLAASVISDGKFTNVSNQAMRYRLLDLKLAVDAAEVQPRLL